MKLNVAILLRFWCKIVLDSIQKLIPLFRYNTVNPLLISGLRRTWIESHTWSERIRNRWTEQRNRHCPTAAFCLCARGFSILRSCDFRLFFEPRGLWNRGHHLPHFTLPCLHSRFDCSDESMSSRLATRWSLSDVSSLIDERVKGAGQRKIFLRFAS